MRRYVLRIERVNAEQRITEEVFSSLESLAPQFRAHRNVIKETSPEIALEIVVRKLTDDGEAELTATERTRLREILAVRKTAP